MTLLDDAIRGLAFLEAVLLWFVTLAGTIVVGAVALPFAVIAWTAERAGWEPTGRSKCFIEGHEWESKTIGRECKRCGKAEGYDYL